jgi:hypothetical protein
MPPASFPGSLKQCQFIWGVRVDRGVCRACGVAVGNEGSKFQFGPRAWDIQFLMEVKVPDQRRTHNGPLKLRAVTSDGTSDRVGYTVSFKLGLSPQKI